jgi:hypothetical protein
MKRILLIFATLLSLVSTKAQLIDKIEYYWDDDPGVGMGTSTSITPTALYDGNLTIDPAGLKAGPHILGVRSHTDDGVWGTTLTRRIVVHRLVEAEYFWDIDPGVGNGLPTSIDNVSLSINQTINVSTEGISGGRHLLGVRTKGVGGHWSPTSYFLLNVGTQYSDGEYFWDFDPGHGNATPFTLPNDENDLDADVQISNVGLTAGRHVLYTRVRGSAGSFGPTYAKTIYITRSIVGGEYFWDTDPGVGNGTPLGTLTVGSTAQTCDDVSTVGLVDGIHYLYVRTLSDDNVWSIPSRVQFTVTPSDVLVGCPGDFNRDGNINTADLLILIASFGSEGGCSVDLSGDFQVNTTDLLIFLAVFGATCE